MGRSVVLSPVGYLHAEQREEMGVATRRGRRRGRGSVQTETGARCSSFVFSLLDAHSGLWLCLRLVAMPDMHALTLRSTSPEPRESVHVAPANALVPPAVEHGTCPVLADPSSIAPNARETYPMCSQRRKPLCYLSTPWGLTSFSYPSPTIRPHPSVGAPVLFEPFVRLDRFCEIGTRAGEGKSTR